MWRKFILCFKGPGNNVLVCTETTGEAEQTVGFSQHFNKGISQDVFLVTDVKGQECCTVEWGGEEVGNLSICFSSSVQTRGGPITDQTSFCSAALLLELFTLCSKKIHWVCAGLGMTHCLSFEDGQWGEGGRDLRFLGTWGYSLLGICGGLFFCEVWGRGEFFQVVYGELLSIAGYVT